MTDINKAFVFLDSTRSVAQSVQHKLISAYAQEQLLDISFYGAELLGLEHKHSLLDSYIASKRSKNYLLFNIYQIYDISLGFDISLITRCLNSGSSIFFTLQKIKITNQKDLNSILLDLKVTHITKQASSLNKNMFL